MIVTEILTQTECYRVEVSGGDENRAFFVEKFDLVRDDIVGKPISLRHMLSGGAMVFVRMLQTEGLGKSPHSTSQVEFIGCDQEDRYEFRLNAFQPRGASFISEGCRAFPCGRNGEHRAVAGVTRSSGECSQGPVDWRSPGMSTYYPGRNSRVRGTRGNRPCAL